MPAMALRKLDGADSGDATGAEGTVPGSRSCAMGASVVAGSCCESGSALPEITASSAARMASARRAILSASYSAAL